VRVILAICLFLLAPPLVGTNQQPQKPVTPDRNAFTFLDWNLNLRVDTAAESLSVRGKIMLRNDSVQPQQQIALQISSSLKWAAIQQNGTAIPFTVSQIRSDLDHSGNVQEAVLTLPSAVVPGASLELEVGYSGTVSLDTTRLAELGVPLAVRTATDYDRITPTFTCLRGVGHVLWFPLSLEPALMGDGNRVFEETSAWIVRHSSSTMTVSIDTSGQAFSVWLGNAQDSMYESMGGASAVEMSWKHLGFTGPVIVSGAYQGVVARQNPENFLISYFPEHQSQAGDYQRIIHDTLPTVTGKSKFPVSLIELPETQDSTFNADTVLLAPLKPIDRKSLELTIAYMLAHQSLWSPRAWIYEGAAHLAQVLMRERQDRRGAAIAFMAERLPTLALVDTGAPERAKSNSLVNTTSEVFYRTKAMYVWWMLRELVGERALLDSLREYDPAEDRAPSYIQKLLEKNSHKDLEWFFDDWVYQDRGLPEFTITNGYARPSLQGIFLVSATIENSGSAAAEVPVIVHTESGDVVTRLRVLGHNKNALRVEVNTRPLDITVNDGTVPEVDRSDNSTSIRIGNQ
jgi:hypothetical protein